MFVLYVFLGASLQFDLKPTICPLKWINNCLNCDAGMKLICWFFALEKSVIKTLHQVWVFEFLTRLQTQKWKALKQTREVHNMHKNYQVMSQPFLHCHAPAIIFTKITHLLKFMQMCKMHETKNIWGFHSLILHWIFTFELEHSSREDACWLLSS